MLTFIRSKWLSLCALVTVLFAAAGALLVETVPALATETPGETGVKTFTESANTGAEKYIIIVIAGIVGALVLLIAIKLGVKLVKGWLK